MIRQLKSIVQSKVAKNGMWLLVLQGFNTIIPLLTFPYITRVISKSAFGEFSLALNWIGYIQAIVEYGFTLSGARKVATAKNESEYSILRSNIFVGRLLLMLCCIVLLIAVRFIFAVPETQFVCMISLFLMVIAIVFQQTWFFQGISEMKNIAVINVTGRIISLILIFLFIKGSDDLYLYCLFYSINILMASILGFFIVGKKYRVKLRSVSFANVITELKDGWPLFLSMAMTRVFGGIGVTILGFVATTEVVGAYSAINKIPYILTLVFAAFSQAVYPQSCKNFSTSFHEGVKSIKKYAVPIVAMFGVGGIILTVFHKQIVWIIFGTEYVEFSVLLLPFVLWTIMGIVNNFLGIQILVASGHQKEYSKDFSFSVIFMIITMMIMGYFWNAYGIAIASMFSEIFFSCMLLKDICKIYRRNKF